VAAALEVSLVVAREHLLHMERLQLLCRDESIEGVFFYENRFKDW
jgi:hypothetical protein